MSVKDDSLGCWIDLVLLMINNIDLPMISVM